MYKFEIYRNPEPPNNKSFYDAVRYNTNGYVFERTITPLWNDLVFRWEREDDRMFFRKKLEGTLTLTGDDFTWANGVRLSDFEMSKYRILVIKEYVDKSWQEVWRGFWGFVEGEWDLENCFVKISKVQVWDRYNQILENIERERNLLEVAPFFSEVNIPDIQYSSDQYKETYQLSYTFDYECIDGNTVYPDLIVKESEKFEDTKWVLYSKTAKFVEKKHDSTAGTWTFKWNVTRTYRRDYLIQVNDPGGNWVVLESPYPPGSGSENIKYVRGYKDIEEDVGATYTANYNVATAYWTVDELLEPLWCEIKDVSSYLNIPNNIISSTDRARWLKDVIKFQLTETDLLLTQSIVSHFLFDTTNPITGKENKLAWIFLIQLTDLFDTSDPATRAMYTFKDVETWLFYLNAFWMIDDDGRFRIEHRKYFDNGLSYTTANISDVVVEGRNKFIYKSKRLPRIERIVMNNVGGDDFYGEPMVYNSSLANWDTDNVITYDTGNIYTDIAHILENEDSVGKDGFLMVITEGFGKWDVVVDTGKITGKDIINEPLSIAGVEDSYWKYGRPVPEGFMNRARAEFEQANNFEQEEFSVAWCGDFNPYELIKTSYGDGRVESASLTLKDNKLTMMLSYPL